MTYDNDDELIISWQAPLEPCPEGRHALICVDVVPLEPEEATYDGVTRFYEKVMVVFQAFPEDGSRDTKGKLFQIERKFTKSLSPDGHLRPFLEKWRGRDFTDEELSNFKLTALRGAPAWGTIIHNTRFVNIQGIEPYSDNDGKALPSLKAEAYIRRNYKKREKAQTTTQSTQPSSPGGKHDGGIDPADLVPF